MSIDLPSRLGNSNTALILQLQVYLFVLGVFVRNYCLFVVSSHNVRFTKMPYSVTVGLIVGEIPLKVGVVVGKDPLAFHELVLSPIANQLGSSIIVGISALAMLLAKHPPSRVDVFVCVSICSLPMFDSIFPLP